MEFSWLIGLEVRKGRRESLVGGDKELPSELLELHSSVTVLPLPERRRNL